MLNLVPNIELLKKKGDYLNTNDMMEVFRIGRTTLWKLEKDATDGFPQSTRMSTKKLWLKTSVWVYIRACDSRAANHLKKMIELKFAPRV